MTSADSSSSSNLPSVGTLARLVPGPTQLRAELEDLVARELLGPRGGPDEEVTEGRIQDRYLVGMLAPKNKIVRASEMDSLAEDGEGSVDEGSTDDSALPADTLYPSSIGLTCTVQGEARQISVAARWGRYVREKSATATTPQGNPTTVWKRYPMGNVGRVIALAEGSTKPTAMDPNQPEIFLQTQHRTRCPPRRRRCTAADRTEPDGIDQDRGASGISCCGMMKRHFRDGTVLPRRS
jgi:hypothetical protein